MVIKYWNTEIFTKINVNVYIISYLWKNVIFLVVILIIIFILLYSQNNMSDIYYVYLML